MNRKLVSVIAALTAFAATAALAQQQQQQAAPKVGKAEVQKLIAGIKSNKTKFAQYCEITKLDIEAGELAQKNQNDPKLQELSQKMADVAAKIGPDYQRIVTSDIDQASAALFDNLSKSCNVGFKPVQAPPKASKADVQKLVDSIKSDPGKLDAFCTQTKLAYQAGAIARKNPKDPKLVDIGKQMDDLGQTLGAEYQRVVSSDIDRPSTALLENLYKSCK